MGGYSCPIWLVLTNLLPAVEIRLLEGFHSVSLRRNRWTDGHDQIDPSSDADQEYKYFMGS